MRVPDQHQRSVSRHRQADGDQRNDEDRQHCARKTQPIDHKQQCRKDEKYQRIFIVCEHQRVAIAGIANRASVSMRRFGCSTSKKPGRSKMNTSGARIAIPRTSPRYQVRNSCHQGPASTNSSVHDAPSALVTAVAPITATARKPNSVPAFRKVERTAEPIRQENSRENYLDRVGGRHAERKLERISINDVGRRIRKQTHGKIVEPESPWLRRYQPEQHSVRKPDRGDAFRLPREHNPQAMRTAATTGRRQLAAHPTEDAPPAPGRYRSAPGNVR